MYQNWRATGNLFLCCYAMLCFMLCFYEDIKRTRKHHSILNCYTLLNFRNILCPLSMWRNRYGNFEHLSNYQACVFWFSAHSVGKICHDNNGAYYIRLIYYIFQWTSDRLLRTRVMNTNGKFSTLRHITKTWTFISRYKTYTSCSSVKT
jgi:hypothetical protein